MQWALSRPSSLPFHRGEGSAATTPWQAGARRQTAAAAKAEAFKKAPHPHPAGETGKRWQHEGAEPQGLGGARAAAI